MTQPDDRLLASLFDEARSENVEPSDDLLTRVLADADECQPKAPSVSAAKASFWDRLLSGVGGWPALSGVTAAGVAGLWIGLTPPDVVDDWVANAMGNTTSVSFVDDFAGFDEVTLDG